MPGLAEYGQSLLATEVLLSHTFPGPMENVVTGEHVNTSKCQEMTSLLVIHLVAFCIKKM